MTTHFEYFERDQPASRHNREVLRPASITWPPKTNVIAPAEFREVHNLSIIVAIVSALHHAFGNTLEASMSLWLVGLVAFFVRHGKRAFWATLLLPFLFYPLLLWLKWTCS